MKKSFGTIMRSLHRDVGFLVIGLTLVYSISGILLIYRESDFLKSTKTIEKTIKPNMKIDEIGRMLHMHEIKVLKQEENKLILNVGEYNMVTGKIKYTAKELPAFLDNLTGLHKAGTNGFVFWFTTLYGISLCFLALSSFWMYQIRSSSFKRGIYFALSGLVITIVLLMFVH